MISSSMLMGLVIGGIVGGLTAYFLGKKKK